jgi:LysM repeat protein
MPDDFSVSICEKSAPQHSHHIMNTVHILTSSLLALGLVSCASQKASEYDTSNPYGTADAGQVAPPAPDPANPIYDTPAAYEESGAAPAAAVSPDMAAAAGESAPASVPANAPASIHTVVAGDTLSGISKKYKIPSASIKQANRMTNDVVVLGRKMVIPPR